MVFRVITLDRINYFKTGKNPKTKLFTVVKPQMLCEHEYWLRRIKFCWWFFFTWIHALRKSRDQKSVKSEIGPLTAICLIKLVWRFEENGTLEKHLRSGQQCLTKARSIRGSAEKNALVSNWVDGTCSGRKIPDSLTYHHPCYVIFFIDSFICIHKGCCRAMNVYQHVLTWRGKAFAK